jgi:hypothetical protein
MSVRSRRRAPDARRSLALHVRPGLDADADGGALNLIGHEGQADLNLTTTTARH